ncbi:MAG: prepilin-type N-terminal cleavage/methylation domain-containing protein [Planctomycetes bacterium]|nr:prepilin-type N-terminal cleavage/methylation domain-containing protein [Planctomycetota bacterium]
MHAGHRHRRGMSLIEVLMASTLLLVAAVPITSAILKGATLSRDIELRTRATLLAQRLLEAAMASAADNFAAETGLVEQDLGNRFVGKKVSTISGLRKTITVQVGWDGDANGHLGGDEVLAVFGAVVANTGS